MSYQTNPFCSQYQVTNQARAIFRPIKRLQCPEPRRWIDKWSSRMPIRQQNQRCGKKFSLAPNVTYDNHVWSNDGPVSYQQAITWSLSIWLQAAQSSHFQVNVSEYGTLLVSDVPAFVIIFKYDGHWEFWIVVQIIFPWPRALCAFK